MVFKSSELPMGTAMKANRAMNGLFGPYGWSGMLQHAHPFRIADFVAEVLRRAGVDIRHPSVSKRPLRFKSR